MAPGTCAERRSVCKESRKGHPDTSGCRSAATSAFGRLREPAGTDPGWLKQARVRWHLRRAVMITWCIAGDPSFIYSALARPHGKWWEPETPESRRNRLSRAWVRWVPWRRSSASWQAAYNTACLYAALADAARRGCAPHDTLRELERRVIVSLRRVVDNPHSELERAWDWISGDPDFRVMRDDREKFKAFGEFLDELEQQEYPASMVGSAPTRTRTAPGISLWPKDGRQARNPRFSPRCRTLSPWAMASVPTFCRT
jgi:hypothetical protein